MSKFYYIPEYGPEDLDEEEVKRAGCVNCLPDGNEIQVDLDSELAYTEFKSRMSLMWQMCGVAMAIKVTPSKTPGHYHVRLFFDVPQPFTAMERIALQAILGSDFKRELFGWFRAMNDNPNPTSFLEVASWQGKSSVWEPNLNLMESAS